MALSWSVGLAWAWWYAKHGKTNLYIRVRSPSLMVLEIAQLLVYTSIACLREIFSASSLVFPCVLSNLATLGATAA